jgi:5S rRNA maturation endonuclease (ribonuclease M5)
MNCKQLNFIPLEEVLASLGHLPTKQSEKEAWYLNPFGSESQASFKVDRKQNLWFLFSEGVGGTTTDFVQKYLNCSVSEALKWGISQNSFSFHQQEQLKAPKPPPAYTIDKVIDLQHPNLKNYLFSRGLSVLVYPFVKEVHFSFGYKKLYAIGFENCSGGWELRNPYYKGALSSHDISLFSIGEKSTASTDHTNPSDGNVTKILVFEGFMDALSFIQMQKSYQGDLLVLNSIALIGRAMEHLKNYDEIGLFLDNDKRGELTKKEILQAFPHARDYSGLYKQSKDLNAHLMQKKGLVQAFETTNKPQDTKDSREREITNQKQAAANKKRAGRRM